MRFFAQFYRLCARESLENRQIQVFLVYGLIEGLLSTLYEYAHSSKVYSIYLSVFVIPFSVDNLLVAVRIVSNRFLFLF